MERKMKQLSPKQTTIVEMMEAGKTNKEIANEMNISRARVIQQKREIRLKMEMEVDTNLSEGIRRYAEWFNSISEDLSED
jgi:DNA-binding CsgD family transcriptional regulator